VKAPGSRIIVRTEARRVASALAAGLLLVPAASAQVQSAAQRSCIVALNKAGEKVAAAVRGELARCLSAAARDRLPFGQTIDECLAADARGHVAAAYQATARIAGKRCGTAPDFGASTAAMVNAGYTPQRVVQDVFGTTLAGVVADAAADPAGARCQKALRKAINTLGRVRLRLFGRCARAGVRNGSITSAAELAGCRDEDPDGKLVRLAAKLGHTVGRRCGGADLAALAPGECASAGVGGILECIAPRLRYDACLDVQAANALPEFENGVAICRDAPYTTWSAARIWDEETLAAIRVDNPRPPVHARNLFHVSAAMWDAWRAYDDTGDAYLVDEHPVASGDVEDDRAIAIGFAAYRILHHRYTNSLGADQTLPALDARMAALGLDPTFTSTVGDSPAAVGNRIGAAYVAYGLTDGSNEVGNYADPNYEPVNEPLIVKLPGTTMVDPNRWQPLSLDYFVSQNGIPLPISVQTFVGSNWDETAPFALPGGGDPYDDPGPPPLLGTATDAQFKANAVELIRLSGQLDPDDGVTLDISPGALHNNTLGTNDGTGYPVNPATGQPYAPNVVKRGDYGRILAEFWADGPTSETPPGHWNVIANYVSDHPLVVKRIAGTGPVVSDLEWDVKMYLGLNGAVHDAAIACWDSKEFYDYVRPISMIRYMGGLGQSSDPGGPSYDPEGLPLEPGVVEVITAATTAPGERHEALAGHEGEIAIYAWPGEPADRLTQHSGARWIRAVEWVPYQRNTFVTPPFAAYTSGHSTFSRAGAEYLTRFTGDSYFPGGLGEYSFPANRSLYFEQGPSQDLTLQWARYYDASDEAGISRLWGGIHVRADDFNGRIMGARIGTDAYELAARYWAGTITP
jgi:hypothetical protein